MINDVLLRWGVTGLFVLSAAVWGFAMVTQRRAWTSAVRNGLHFVMAIAMAVMVWPWGAQSPTTGPTVFFLLATAWFVTMIIVAAQTTAQRAACGYHALMMLAMAWMYADTKHHHFPNHSGMHHPTSPATPMPGMDGAATGMAASAIARMGQCTQLVLVCRLRGRGGLMGIPVHYRAAVRRS